MRNWKIRTKMIAGLSMLVLVIMLLIYSSYSQMVRDRGLATEISQLAEQIEFAHNVNQSATALLRAHSRFVHPEKSDSMSLSDAMIESDRIMATNWIERYRSYEEDGIVKDIGQLQALLGAYRKKLDEHISTRRVTPLLVDRNRQSASLNEMKQILSKVDREWCSLSGSEAAIRSRDHRNETLSNDLNRLSEVALSHFGSIQSGMKSFDQNVRSEQRAKQNAFFMFTGLAAFLITLLAWQFWSLIVVPFQTLLRGSELIADGHKSHKILLGTDDEISRMANTVNEITEGFNLAVAEVTQAKLHAEQEVRDRTREVIQNEQLAHTGFLAAGVAHEINNPLGIIAWTAEAVEGSLDDLTEQQRELIDPEFLSELTTSLSDIQSEAFRCKGITKRLLYFSRLSDSSRESEDLGALIESVVSMVSKVGEYRCKTLTAHCEPEVAAHCNSQEIQQVVLNLISNALESVATDGRVDVYVRNEVDPLSGVEQATVIVQDDGCGMSQEVIDHLFEPFFTRRQDNTGTGLGLSISYRIVSLHHGSLTPHSDGEGCGSKMVLRLPVKPSTDETVASVQKPKQIEANQSESDLLEQWKHVQKAA